jgi:DNA-binding LacI/PurR family transcriptional regulator
MNIEDIARIAGVSVATVSRVINGHSMVKAETAEKVLKAIHEYGYVPNQAARNLRKNESMTLAILAPNFTNPYYAHILAGIGDTAQTLGYSVFIRNVEFGKSEIDYIIKNQRADGIIILSSPYDAGWLDDYSSEVPIVLCCEYSENSKLPRVSIDNYKAAYEAVEYLLDLGHRRIAMISSSNKHISTKLRHEGYRDALNKAGIDVRSEYSVMAAPDYSYNSGYMCANKLFSLSERPTAIFCISDILAISAIAAAGDRGLSVPADVSIMGFDDVDYTTMFRPHLTTISQPCYELGSESIKAIHQYKTGFPESPKVEPMPHKLIMRESTTPCKA